jgi:hypothetical protein
MESSDEEEEVPYRATQAQLPFLFRKDKPKPPVLIEASKSDLSDDIIQIWYHPDNGKLEFKFVPPPPSVPPPRPPRVARPVPPPAPPQLIRRQPPPGSPPAPKKKLCE